MRKILSLSLCALLAICMSACRTEIEPYVKGESLGEVIVDATAGSLSVSVDLKCKWRVSSEADWLTIDISGQEGSGAFSFNYLSNESDVSISKSSRKASIIITRLDTYRNDTLSIIQRGIPDGRQYESHIIAGHIEVQQEVALKKSILICNLQGVGEDEAMEWLNGRKEDIISVIWNSEAVSSYVPLDEKVKISNNNLMILADATIGEKGKGSSYIITNTGGLNIQVADFGETLEEGQSRYVQLDNILENGYNHPGSSDMWIIAGSFYFLSSAEFGYPDTPSWYPSKLDSPEFDADIHAWKNNLIDCIWMTSKKYNITYSNGEKEWRADYVFASKSAWNSLMSVELLTDVILKHKPIKVTIKY